MPAIWWCAANENECNPDGGDYLLALLLIGVILTVVILLIRRYDPAARTKT